MIGHELREGVDGVEWLIIRGIRADKALLGERLDRGECILSTIQHHTVLWRPDDPRDRQASSTPDAVPSCTTMWSAGALVDRRSASSRCRRVRSYTARGRRAE